MNSLKPAFAPVTRSRLIAVETRVLTLGRLLDDIWEIATDAIGQDYIEAGGTLPTSQADPKKLADALHAIAEKAAQSFGSLKVG